MMSEWLIREMRESMANDLAGWEEPSGHLVPSEPDAAERAVVRIELRTAIAVLDRVLGQPQDGEANTAATHRDRIRIADDAIKNYLPIDA